MRTRRHGCLASLFGVLLLCAAVVYGVAGVTSPWSFHIGGRWTPLLSWSGFGELHTQNGAYPLYVTFYPSSHFSRLHLDGLRPSGGLQGSGWLCTSKNTIQRLTLSGTLYGGWRSTENSLLQFRLLDRRILNVGQRQGYFDLYGRFQGAELVMDDRGRWAATFRSGLKIEHASITFDWGSYSDFKALCGGAEQ
jgi:hypothetical protein